MNDAQIESGSSFFRPVVLVPILIVIGAIVLFIVNGDPEPACILDDLEDPLYHFSVAPDAATGLPSGAPAPSSTAGAIVLQARVGKASTAGGQATTATLSGSYGSLPLQVDALFANADMSPVEAEKIRYLDIDALSWGVDWVPVERCTVDGVETWCLDGQPDVGWGAIFYTVEHDDAVPGFPSGAQVFSYAWGSVSAPVPFGPHQAIAPAELGLDPSHQLDAFDITGAQWALDAAGSCIPVPIGAACLNPTPRLYFSVSRETVEYLPASLFSGSTDAASGATVFEVSAEKIGGTWSWAAPTIYFPPNELGLVQDDDVDALALDLCFAATESLADRPGPGPVAMISLAAGSPSNGGAAPGYLDIHPFHITLPGPRPTLGPLRDEDGNELRSTLPRGHERANGGCTSDPRLHPVTR